jgi:hypothetical protein
MRLVSGRGLMPPRAIAQIEKRVDMPKFLIFGPSQGRGRWLTFR